MDPYQETSLVALERLELAADVLEPRGFVDWEMSPWISEHLTGLILPLQVGGHRLLVSWDGIVAVRQFHDGQVRMQGRTGAMGSVISANRTGARSTVRGFHGDRTVDYTVDEEVDEIRVEGDTGRFRSCYLIQFRSDEVVLAGDHGEFDSNYSARFHPGEVHLAGLRGGERVDCRIFQDGNSLHLEGAYQGSQSNLVLQLGDAEWNLQGFLRGEPVHLVVRLAQHALEFTGSVPVHGIVHFALQGTEDGFWVRGKIDNHHLNYRLICSSAESPARTPPLASGDAAPA